MWRSLRRLLLAAALGILTTIAVAWALATRFADTQVRARCADRAGSSRAPFIALSRYDRPGAIHIHTNSGHLESFVPFARDTTPEALVPLWARPILVPSGWNSAPPPGWYSSRLLIAYGWPCPALWCAFEDVPNPVGYWGHRVLVGIKVSDTWRGFRSRPLPGDPPVTLPTCPMWPNFLLNAALFAAAWYAALTGCGAARRALRRRRGRCPRCAYDLQGLPAGSPCPECGRHDSPGD